MTHGWRFWLLGVCGVFGVMCLTPQEGEAQCRAYTNAQTYTDTQVMGHMDCDTAGNQRVTIPPLSGEDQTNNVLMTRTRPFATYQATNTFTPPATPTDMITITGSASKTVKVWSVRLCTTNTAAGSQEFSLIKRSTADTGGTAVATTPVALDSSNLAATATVNHYTANPAALGTAVGTLTIVRWASPVAVPGSFAGVVEDACRDLIPQVQHGQALQPVALYGTAQQLAVNFNGAALVAGQVHAFTVTMSEE